MKKIGILTFFYNSNNYGGVLQAYALNRTIEKMGYPVEQICYDYKYYPTLKYKIKKILDGAYKHIFEFKQINLDRKIQSGIKERSKAFQYFVDRNINKSSKVYNNVDISESISQYDCFITGSDQVWSGTSSVFFLNFVPCNKKKISYAASISRDKLSSLQKELFPKYLSTFDKISVREHEAVNLLNDIGVNAEWVLDPTLLLSRNEWDSISSERLIEYEYILCYFLGDEDKQRNAAKIYAEKHNLKIITFPYMMGHYNGQDEYADVKLFDASPADFISLIKYANVVFTDSYHATIFSCIYKKDFLTFNRVSQYGSMASRFTKLLELFDLTEHFVDYYELDERIIINKAEIEDNQKYVEFRNKSLDYLRFSLK